MRKSEAARNASKSRHQDAHHALGTLGRFLKGRGVSKSELAANGVPCLRYAEIYTTYGDFTYELRSFVDHDASKSALAIEHGDIIFAASGETAAEIGKAVAYLGNGKAVVGGDTVVLRGHGQDPSFLGYALNADDAVRQKSRLGKGQSVVHIHAPDLSKIEVWLPPVPEQRKVAEILRTWDEAIEKANVVIGLRERQHLALVHQLVFGQRRLSNFATSREKTTHRWFDLPSDWQVAPVGRLANEISEKNGDETATEVLSCSKYEGFVRSLEYFRKQVFSGDLSGYKRIWRGDFGFPSNHVEEGSIGLQDLVDVGLVSPIYTIFRFDPSKVDSGYAYGVLKTSLYRHIFEVSTSASVDRRGSLRWKEFAKIPFPVPSLAEQRAVRAVLGENRNLIDRLKAERDALERQKRGLMQKLLTGEWRVKC